MVNTREYNKKRFSIFESEEKTALELMNELGQACNEVLDRADQVEILANDNKNKKVSYDDLHTKYQLTTDGTNANFNGSWQGLKKPTLSQEGAFAQVEKNSGDIDDIKSELVKKAYEHDVIKKGDVGLDDCKEDLLLAIQNNDSVNTFNLLSVPRDLSVTAAKTNFLIEQNNNLLKYITFETGKAVNNKNGGELIDSYYALSDYIPVSGNTDYILSVNFNIAYYTSDKTFISGLVGGWRTNGKNILTTPSTCAYMRITVHADTSIKRIMTKGKELKDYSEYSFVSDLDKSLLSFINNNVNSKHFVYTDSIEMFNVNTSNLLHHVNITDHAYIDYKSGLVANVTDSNSGLYKYKCTDYIEIEGNQQYCCTQTHNIAFYDEYKQYISGLTGGWSNPLVAPTSAKYIRLSLVTGECYFSKSASLPSEEERQLKLSFSNDIWKNAFLNLLNNENKKLANIKWNVLGDSITSTNYSRPNWWEIIKGKYGLTVNNYGISGTTLAHTDDRHLWDYEFGKLDAETIGYNALDPSTWSTGNCMCERFTKMSDDADLITVMGCTNDGSVKLGTWDSTDTSTFYGALNVLITGLISKYPNKKIAFFTPIQAANSYISNVGNAAAELDKKTSTDTLSLQLRAEAIKRKCKQYSIPCLDLFNESGINGVGGRKTENYRKDDNLHPSVNGNKNMSVVIENFILSLF